MAGREEGEDDLLAGVAVGEAGDGSHGGDGVGDFRGTDDDAGAGAGESEFREAEGEDDVVVEEWCGFGEDGTWEGKAVGVIDDEGDVVGFGEGRKPFDFAVGQDIAGWVGGPGHADRPDSAPLEGGFDCGEIDAVLELVGCCFPDDGLAADEEAGFEALVGVANVFRDEG